MLRVWLHVAVLTVVCLLLYKTEGKLREHGAQDHQKHTVVKVRYKHKRGYRIGTTWSFVIVLSWL